MKNGGILIAGNSGKLDISEAGDDGYCHVFDMDCMHYDSFGFYASTTENDPGDITGNRLNLNVVSTEDYRLKAGVDQYLFNEFFQGTVLNSSLYHSSLSSMTTTINSGACNLNAGNSVTSGHYNVLTTRRTFCSGNFELSVKVNLKILYAPKVNNVVEFGLGLASGTSAPSDGCYVRIKGDGYVNCVANYNGTETLSDDIHYTELFEVNKSFSTDIMTNDKHVEFWINDYLAARIPRANAAPAMNSSHGLPVFVRIYNSGNVSGTAQQVNIGSIVVSNLDMDLCKDWAHSLPGAGNQIHQTGTGITVANTVQWANSAAPTAFTPTNTTAPTGSVGLGGNYIVTASGLAVNTDYCVQSFLVPNVSSTTANKSLYITGYRITAISTGANTAGVIAAMFGLGIGNTTVSIAAAESATAKATRRIPVGIARWASGAVPGTVGASNLSVEFASPVVVNAGQYVQTIMRFLSYTTAASWTIRLIITYCGYME